MIGLGLTLTRRQSSPLAQYAVSGVVPVMVLDFERGYLTGPVSVARASAKTVFDASGALVSVAADTPAYDWGSGRQALLLETAATRLNGYVTTKAAWCNSIGSAVLTDLAEAALGQFPGLQIASAGDATGRAASAITVTSGLAYTIKYLWQPGSSGRVLFRARNTTASTQSDFGGPVATLAAVTSAAGTLSLLSDRTRGSLRETVLLFTPNFSGACQVGIGPYSSTAGQTVVAHACQIEQGSAESSWILGDTGASVTRAADLAGVIGLSTTAFGGGYGVRVAAQVRAGATGLRRLVQLDAGTAASQQILVWSSTAAALSFEAYAASVKQAGLTLGGTQLTDFKTAFSGATNAFRAARDGAAATAVTTGSYTPPQMLRLGQDATGTTAPQTLRLYSVSIFAQALSDAQLIAATQ